MNIAQEIAKLHARYTHTEAKVDEALEVVVKSRFTTVCTVAWVLLCMWIGWFVRGLV